MQGIEVFEEHESQVRSYCRDFPVVFTRAEGHTLTDENGTAYIDFLSGAGALNYGHNNPLLKERLCQYIQDDGVTHSLDLYTQAKRKFMEALYDAILAPRKLDYRMQFTGPTGANAVEAALKLARLVTGRQNVVAFTNGFHGMSLGALSVSGSRRKRGAAGVPFASVDRVPFDGYLGPDFDSLRYLEAVLEDPGSGVDLPAAIIVETVQAEGGLNAAGTDWLRRLENLTHRHGALLIVDEIQTGCGRTGPFFSFERAGLQPDIICLAKSIGGYGLPLAMVLLRPGIDVWKPGQHNGTFRGNNLAFVAGAAALDFWRDALFEDAIDRKAVLVRNRLGQIARRLEPDAAVPKGLGLLQGLALREDGLASRIARRAFRLGVIAETCGARDEVLKIMPPLTIPDDALCAGLARIEEAIAIETAKPALELAS